MDEGQIRTVLKVAECGSITSAASKLFMSVQGLKRQLDTLEQEELGCALFKRTSTGVILTEQGKTFCNEAPALLAQMAGFIERVRSAQSLQLRIAIWGGKQIPILDAICAEYCRQLPECPVVFVPANQERAIEDIEEGVADISFQSRETGVVDASRLSYASVGISMGFKCVMTPSSPLAEKDSVEREDLAPYPLAAAGGYELGWSQKISHHLGIAFEKTLSYERYDIMSFCLTGGVCICDEYLADALVGLAAKPLAWAKPVEMLVVSRKELSYQAARFIEVARKTASEPAPIGRLDRMPSESATSEEGRYRR